MLDTAQDAFMATAYRTALIVALEEFFGRVQVFGTDLALTKYCQKERPERARRPSGGREGAQSRAQLKAYCSKLKYARKRWEQFQINLATILQAIGRWGNT